MSKILKSIHIFNFSENFLSEIVNFCYLYTFFQNFNTQPEARDDRSRRRTCDDLKDAAKEKPEDVPMLQKKFSDSNLLQKAATNGKALYYCF